MDHKEKQIIEGIAKGNAKYFEALFKEYYTQMCRMALKYVKSPDIAEEIVQDIFYNLWKKRKDISINASIKSYMFRSVFNNSLQYLQHQNVVRKFVNEKQYLNNFEEYNPHEALKYNELLGVLNTALSSLPERTRSIFLYSRFEGLKYHEIADKLAISIKTVEANMGKALKHLRLTLSDYTMLILIIIIKIFS